MAPQFRTGTAKPRERRPRQYRAPHRIAAQAEREKRAAIQAQRVALVAEAVSTTRQRTEDEFLVRAQARLLMDVFDTFPPEQRGEFIDTLRKAHLDDLLLELAATMSRR